MDAKVEEESHLKGYIVEQHDSVDVGMSSNLISSHTASPISFHFAPPFLCLSLSFTSAHSKQIASKYFMLQISTKAVGKY